LYVLNRNKKPIQARKDTRPNSFAHSKTNIIAHTIFLLTPRLRMNQLIKVSRGDAEFAED